jgi:carboxyl-terminal processing protease
VFGRERRADRSGKSGRADAEKAVARALDVLQTRALFADRVEDWAAARAEVHAAFDDPEQLELALFHLARRAGGPQSGVRRTGRATPEQELPAVEVLDDAAVLRIPACLGDGASYVDAARRATTGIEAARWIVDLRGTGGGALWPMLAAVAPLLRGDGDVGALVLGDGSREAWHLADGVLTLAGHEMARGEAGRRPGPVSVLTDGDTAASAEGVAIAFRGLPDARSYGAATLGIPTGSTAVPLPGGLQLTVTTSRFADRTGHVYEGPLTPDVPGEDPLSLALWDL